MRFEGVSKRFTVKDYLESTDDGASVTCVFAGPADTPVTHTFAKKNIVAARHTLLLRVAIETLLFDCFL